MGWSGLNSYNIAELLRKDPYITRQLFIHYRNPEGRQEKFNI